MLQRALFHCGNTVQRVHYADSETDHCDACQTGGKVLADQSLSRSFNKTGHDRYTNQRNCHRSQVDRPRPMDN